MIIVSELASMEARRLRAALQEQIDLWEQVPMGPDYQADIDDASPDDAVAHLAGLAIKAARAALGEEGGA